MPNKVIGVLTQVGRDASVAAYCPTGPLGKGVENVTKCLAKYSDARNFNGLNRQRYLRPAAKHFKPGFLSFEYHDFYVHFRRTTGSSTVSSSFYW